MNDQLIRIPPQFAVDTVTREGTAGAAWLESLPQTVAALCQQWQLRIVGPVRHGYTGIAIPVRRQQDACVLKVYWRDEETEMAPQALRIWNGHGAVQLLADDPERGALLLEQLNPDHSLAQVEIGEAIRIAGRLVRRLAIPAPESMRTVRDLAAAMVVIMPQRWERHHRPFPQQLLERVCNWAAELGPNSARLMADYDLHYTDILAGQREPWLMIDPKAIAGDPEFSLAQLLWSRLEEIEADRGIAYHFRTLVEAAGLDAELARRWTIIRCADYWLWGLTVGFTEDPARCQRIIAGLEAESRF